MKAHASDSIEMIEVFIDEYKHPNTYKAKVEELMEGGMSEEDAKYFIDHTPFQMEMYYEKNNGLFFVESEAVESNIVRSPYTQETLETNDD